LEKISRQILNKVNKCVITKMDKAINAEREITRISEEFLIKTEDVDNEAAQCVISNIIPVDAIRCLDNVSTYPVSKINKTVSKIKSKIIHKHILFRIITNIFNVIMHKTAYKNIYYILILIINKILQFT
jgi:hypothetical protein